MNVKIFLHPTVLSPFDWLKGQLYKCPVLVVDMLFSGGFVV